MNTAANGAPAGGFTRWMRLGLIGLCFTFIIGGLVQFFIAGLSVFDDPKYWQDHTDSGRMIGILAYLMPVLALLGRVGVSRVVHAFVVAALFGVQSLLSNVDTAWIAALHPVNGLLLMGAAGSLAGRTMELVRYRGGGHANAD